jgi:phosphoribosylaminoimidazolecarboxamide formyltransferase/IMP cyclohydrolase
VKTLHPQHPRRPARRRTIRASRPDGGNGIEPIDLVVVNLYPFEATSPSRLHVRRRDREHRHRRAVDAALRGEEPRDVAVVVDPADYEPCSPSCAARASRCRRHRQRLARRAFQRRRATTAPSPTTSAPAPRRQRRRSARRARALRKAQDLRYGENPHQKAALYGDFFACVEQLHGKELSYNNIVDINAALWLMREFLTTADGRHPEAQHALRRGHRRTVAAAYRAAYATDPGVAVRRNPHRQPALDPPSSPRSSTRSSPRC